MLEGCRFSLKRKGLGAAYSNKMFGRFGGSSCCLKLSRDLRLERLFALQCLLAGWACDKAVR